MGGIGSGRKWGYGGPTCGGQFAIDVRYLARGGYLRPGTGGVLSWCRNGQVVARVEYLADDAGLKLSAEWVAFVWTPCYLGGRRTWLCCPGCGARVAILYFRARRFRCRRCHGLTYVSQRESPPDRALRRARNIRVRLGGAAKLTAPFPDRPRYMRRSVYDRLRKKVEASEAAWLRSMSSWVDRFGEQIRR